MIPESKPSKSVLWNAGLAAGIIFCVFLMIGIISLLTNDQNRQMAIAVFGAICMVIFCALILWTVRVFFRKLQDQKQFMRRFAEANGWHYEEWRWGNNQGMTLDRAISPPSGPSLEAMRLRFKISGEHNGYPFEYFQLYGFQRKEKSNWPGIMGGLNAGFYTFLRIKGEPTISSKYPLMFYEVTPDYTYVSFVNNARIASDIKHMFEPIDPQ